MAVVSPVLDTVDVGLPDGVEVRISRFVPPEARATLVCLPALGVPASYYEPLALRLASSALAVVTADLRGVGRSSVRPRRGVDFGYARLVDDAATIVCSIRRDLPAPICLLGHSLGGHVGALLAGRREGLVDRLVLAACGTPYWRRFPPAIGFGVLALALATRALGAALGYVPGNRLGFGGTEAAQLMAEWGRLARRGRFDIDGFDGEAALADVRVPVLAVSIAGDRMAPSRAVDHLVGKLRQARCERRHVTADLADRRALDHFRWARFPEGVARLVAEWVR